MWKAPSTLIPGFTRLFEEQQQEQQQLVKTSLIQKEIDTTRVLMQDNMEKICTRGKQLSILDDHASELLQSSEMFKVQSMTWSRRWMYWIRTCNCFPEWWWRKQEQQQQQRGKNKQRM